MNIETCLRLAEGAKNDPSLIPNHTDGKKGVDHYIREHLAEVNEILSCDLDDLDFVDRLQQEKRALEDALAVYEPPELLNDQPN